MKVSIFLYYLLFFTFTLQKFIYELPLEIVQIIPTEQLLMDKQAITIVFNRAVIPIGSDFGRNYSNSDPDIPFYLDCNVPGKYRWVTTSIFRFDPEMWPTDLSCPLRVNPNLKTFDGEVLSNPKTITYKTKKLEMNLVNVISNKTLELTGGIWGFNPQLPEIPPNSEIQLQFNTKIDIVNLKGNLVLKQKERYSIVSLKPCINNNQCVLVRFFRSLKPKTKYELVLRQGTNVNELAGETDRVLSISIQGLLEFKFYFLTINQAVYNRWHLWLIHGLENGTDINKFKDVIQIEPSVDLTFKREQLGILTMEGQFQPQTEYNITVKSSPKIRDGYGLQLIGSSTKIKTSNFPEFLQVPENRLIYFDQFPKSWDIIMRGNPSQDLRFENVNMDNIEKIMNFYREFQIANSNNQLSKTFKKRKNNGLKVYNLKSSSLLNKTGLFAEEKITTYNQQVSYSQYMMVNKATIMAHIISIEPKKILFWITDIHQLKDAINSKVNLYKDGKLVESQFVGNDGIVLFNNTDGYGYSAVVENGNNILFIDEVVSIYSFTNDFLSSLMFSDRKIYNAGDRLYLKGYLRKYDRNQGIESIPSSNVHLTLQYQFLPEIKLDYNPNFGSFYTSFVIPDNATYGYNQVTLKLFDRYIGSLSFLISDPRIPSALLTLDSDSRVIVPDQTTKIIIRLTTYTGAPLQNQDVKLKYRIYKQNICSFNFQTLGTGYRDRVCQKEKEITHGQTILKTDSNGLINYEYSLPSMEGIDYEDIVEFTASYFSPTRETLERNLKLYVSPSDIKITLKTSTSQILPGIPFKLYGYVEDHEMKRIVGQNITVSLYEWYDSIPKNPYTFPTSLEDQSSTSDCTFTSSLSESSVCEFVLPSIGKYIFVATNQGMENVYSTLVVGKNETEWKKNPLRKMNDLNFEFDKPSYKIGDTAIISFLCPFKDSLGLIVWDSYNRHEIKKERFIFGSQSFTIPVTEKCKKGCVVSIILYTPNHIGLEPSTVQVPTSVLYDEKSAQTIQKTLQLKVDEDNVLDFTLKPKDEILSPGASSSVQIQIDPNVTSGQITFWIVDKAILDLKPNDIPTSHFFDFGQITAGMNLDSTTKNFVSLNVYKTTKDILLRRYHKDGYISQNWDLFNYFNNYDKTDQDFLKNLYTTITQQRSSFNPIIPFMRGRLAYDRLESFTPMSAKSLAVDSSVSRGTGGTGTGSSQENIRKFFSLTPLFIPSQPIENGVTTIPFKLPDNIGTFVLNAFIATSDEKFGFKNISIISRKDVNLIPSLPRIVRIGDLFYAGCTVSITDLSFKGEYEVITSLDNGEDLLEIIGIESQRIKIQNTNPIEVTFQFQANGKGTSNIYFFVRGQATDAIKTSIPILGLQEPVFVASSFAISNDSSRDEGILIPPSVGEATLNITTGVGRLPSIITLSESLLNDFSKEVMEYPFCFPSIYFSKTFPKGVFTKYYKDMISKDLLFRAEKFYSLAVKNFKRCTRSNFGLQYVGINQLPSLNIELNIMGLYMAQRLNELDVKFPEDLTQSWKEATLAYLNEHHDNQLDLYAYTHLVIQDWSPSDQNRSLNYLSDNFLKLSDGGRAALGIVLTRLQNSSDVVDQIIQTLWDNVRIQGRTAYFSSGQGSPYETDVISSTLVFQLMILKNQQSPILEKVANYFSSYDSSNSGYNILNLAEYDSFKQNTNPNLVVNILLNNDLILSKLFNDPKEKPKVDVQQLQGNNQTLSFEASGTGEASIAVGISFEPAQLYSTPIYRGIFVEKVIRLLDPNTGDPTGTPITSADPGTAVAVTIQITTPDDLSTVQIIDPLAGCLEAIDTNINSQDSVLYLYSPLNEPTQYRKNEVIFMNYGLNSGTHTYQYKAFIVSSGKFIVPPTKAFVVDQPELMGLSTSNYFEVKKRTQ